MRGELKCPVCGASCRAGDGIRPADFIWCIGCGSSFVMPRAEAPGSHYESFGEFYGWRWEFSECLRDLSELGVRGTLLEVGAGRGDFLQRLPRQLRGVGVDVNPAAVKAGRSTGLDIRLGKLDHLCSEFRGRCDALAVFHVLEHLAYPAEFLSLASEFLTPGGVIVASVPNPNRTVAKVLAEPWDTPPHHVTRFSTRGLRRLLEQAGFVVSKVKDQPRDISPRQLASLMADAGVNRHPRLAHAARGRRLFKLPFALMALPGALRACATGCGTALYIVGTRRA